MYGIQINARTSDNHRIEMVYLRHGPMDADKIVRIRERMLANGWEGRPVILMDCGGHHMAFTGVHRMCAAQGIDELIEAVYLPDDLRPEQWAEIEQANDDDDLLAAFEAIAAERDDMEEVVAAMREEVAANEAA